MLAINSLSRTLSLCVPVFGELEMGIIIIWHINRQAAYYPSSLTIACRCFTCTLTKFSAIGPKMAVATMNISSLYYHYREKSQKGFSRRHYVLVQSKFTR